MPPNRRVTLKQVAERAEVSRAAASFALSGRPGVSDATRTKVLRIASELGYAPNQVAQNLRSSRTGMVAVYLPEDVSTLSYYMEATFGVIDEAEQSGHTVTLIPHRPTGLNRLQADGIIMLDPTRGDPMIGHLLDLGLPVISGEELPEPSDDDLPRPSSPQSLERSAEVAGLVTSDHAASTVELLEHFVARGARRPGIIASSVPMAWSMTVEATYRQWCADRELNPLVEYASLDGLEETTRRATRNLLDTGTVDAILALADGSALNVITSAAEYGRRVGEDLLVAATVDSPVLSYTDPAVTAVDLRPREFGRRCMSVLSRVLDAADASPDTLAEVVDTEVIYRASTRGTAGDR
ncbi:LacI family DNA-binding transcriptional regulator [Brevibacterium sp.]|uniref:LacI family DNA-binding transcriptional regulator n=1 Tax=Brevibacterium sp. TaxID=1701 RepID=UPI002811EECE|nr:LacI family DNA-binding transcriptional regulator [Brevibacterium sp.]